MKKHTVQRVLVSGLVAVTANSAFAAASPKLSPALKNQSAAKAEGTSNEDSPFLSGMTSASFGVNLGAAFGTGGQSSFSRLNLGLAADYKLPSNWTAGAFFGYVPISSNLITAGSVDQSLFLYGVEGMYLFNNIVTPGAIQVGIKLGVSTYTVPSANGVAIAGASSSTDLVYGPKVAYDYPLSKNWTLGGEADVLLTTQSGGNTLINTLGLVKYWFS
jgi:hypothetical protein